MAYGLKASSCDSLNSVRNIGGLTMGEQSSILQLMVNEYAKG